MSNVFSKKEIKGFKKQTRRESSFFGSSGKKKSAESLDKLQGLRKGGAEAKRVIRSSGLSLSKREGVSDIIGSSRKSSSAPKTNQKSVSSSKPKTSWWKAVSSKKGTSQNQGAATSKLGSKSSGSNYNNLSKQFGSAKAGVGYTSKRGSDTASKPHKTSVGGFKKLH